MEAVSLACLFWTHCFLNSASVCFMWRNAAIFKLSIKFQTGPAWLNHLLCVWKRLLRISSTFRNKCHISCHASWPIGYSLKGIKSWRTDIDAPRKFWQRRLKIVGVLVENPCVSNSYSTQRDLANPLKCSKSTVLRLLNSLFYAVLKIHFWIKTSVHFHSHIFTIRGSSHFLLPPTTVLTCFVSKFLFLMCPLRHRGAHCTIKLWCLSMFQTRLHRRTRRGRIYTGLFPLEKYPFSLYSY